MTALYFLPTARCCHHPRHRRDCIGQLMTSIRPKTLFWCNSLYAVWHTLNRLSNRSTMKAWYLQSYKDGCLLWLFLHLCKTLLKLCQSDCRFWLLLRPNVCLLSTELWRFFRFYALGSFRNRLNALLLICAAQNISMALCCDFAGLICFILTFSVNVEVCSDSKKVN